MLMSEKTLRPTSTPMAALRIHARMCEKRCPCAIREGKRLEFRWEALNAFNHPQFTAVPEKMLAAPASRFLNRDFTDSGIRSMWAQVKILF